MRGVIKLAVLTSALGLHVAHSAPAEPAAGREAVTRVAPAALHRVWKDIAGHRRSLVPSGSRRFVVLVFLGHDCPISNATLPAIERIARDFGGAGVTVIGIHSGGRIDAGAVRRHAGDFRVTIPLVLDPRCELADATGASVTPEAAVIDSRGGIAYLGRINNLFAAPGKRRSSATVHDLANALRALIDGKPPTPRRVKAVGCYIKRP